MNAKSKNLKPAWIDPDDAPEVSDDWIAEADVCEGTKLVKRGRSVGSLKAQPKVPTTIRFDVDVADALKVSGRGWQTRVNQLLRDALKTGRL